MAFMWQFYQLRRRYLVTGRGRRQRDESLLRYTKGEWSETPLGGGGTITTNVDSIDGEE